MQWDFRDQLRLTQRQKVNDDDKDGDEHRGERTWYVYDAAGQRVRKVTVLPTGQLKDERIYLGAFEVYRRQDVTTKTVVRETLHIMDDKQRIALVETRTQGDDGSPEQLIRYQLGNHLGSTILKLGQQAQVISYEKYYPYGSTSYQAVNKQINPTTKRYRYTGKERDDEHGLDYFGARYYASWLGRWLAPDPEGPIDGVNLYLFTGANPIRFIDPAGMKKVPPEEHKKHQKTHQEPKKEKGVALTPEQQFSRDIVPKSLKAGRAQILDWARTEEKPQKEYERLIPANPSDPEYIKRTLYAIDYALIKAQSENPHGKPAKIAERALWVITDLRNETKRVPGISESLFLAHAQRYLYGVQGEKWLRHHVETKYGASSGVSKVVVEHSSTTMINDVYEVVKTFKMLGNTVVEETTGKNPGWGRHKGPHSRPGGEVWLEQGHKHFELLQKQHITREEQLRDLRPFPFVQ